MNGRIHNNLSYIIKIRNKIANTHSKNKIGIMDNNQHYHNKIRTNIVTIHQLRNLILMFPMPKDKR